VRHRVPSHFNWTLPSTHGFQFTSQAFIAPTLGTEYCLQDTNFLAMDGLMKTAKILSQPKSQADDSIITETNRKCISEEM
jgi:hypothetical protein